MHIGIINDEKTKQENLKAGRDLCEHCGGTGNELYSMYRKCPKCSGFGYIKSKPVKERMA